MTEGRQRGGDEEEGLEKRGRRRRGVGRRKGARNDLLMVKFSKNTVLVCLPLL